METIIPIKCKWLVMIFTFNDNFCFEISNGIPLEIEMESWKKSITDIKFKNNIQDSDDNIEIVFVSTKVTSYFKNSFTNLESKFTRKIGNKLIKFTPNRIGNIFNSPLEDSTNFEEVLLKIKNHFDPENNLVITLGHGSVFSINPTNKTKIDSSDICKEHSSDLSSFDTKKTNEIFKNQKSNTKRYPDFLEDHSYYILNFDLARSFKRVFGKDEKKAVDVLVMSHCFMQNIYSQFDFHEAVDYLVAPISGISFPGYNIIDAIENLENNLANEQIASNFSSKKSIESHRLYKKPYSDDIQDRWFVQSYQLNSDYQIGFKNLFNAFIDEVFLLAKDCNYLLLKFFKSTIRDCYKYSELSYETVDIFDFRIFIQGLNLALLSKNKNRINDTKLLTIINNLINIMNNQKFDYFIGNRFLDEANTYLDSRPNFNGIELTKSPIELPKIGFGFYFPFKNKGERFNDIINHKTLSPQLIAGSKYLELINLFQNIE